MITSEKIYYAHKGKKISFKTIAFLCEMDESVVAKAYHSYCDELRKAKPITAKDDIKMLGMSLYSTNRLRRAGIRTIKSFAKMTKSQITQLSGLGKVRLAEVLEGWDAAKSVLKGGSER